MNPVSSVSVVSSSLAEEEMLEMAPKTAPTSIVEKSSESFPPPAKTGWVSWIQSWFSSPTPPKPIDLDPVTISSTPVLDPPPPSIHFSSSREVRITDAMLDPLLLQTLASHMKEITVQEIFTLVMASEMSLDQERASIVNDSEKIALRIKKLQDLNTEKVLAILQKDEQLAKYFSIGNNVAAAFTFVAAILTMPAVVAAIPALASFQVLLGVGSVVTSVTSIGEGLSRYRLGETQQHVTVLAHAQKRATDQLEETRSRLLSIAGNQAAIQQQFIYYIKSLFKLSSIINAKN